MAEEAIAETVELTGVVEDGSLIFDVADSAPVITHGNEVLIGGLRIVVRLRQAESVGT